MQAGHLCQLLKASGIVSDLSLSCERAGNPEPNTSPHGPVDHGRTAAREAERRAKLISMFSAKSEVCNFMRIMRFHFSLSIECISSQCPIKVYQNAKMLSKDGELLCHCDLRKLEWYCNKGIAERISEDPPTIRLLFDHKNTDEGTSFYSQSKENRSGSSHCSVLHGSDMIGLFSHILFFHHAT